MGPYWEAFMALVAIQPGVAVMLLLVICALGIVFLHNLFGLLTQIFQPAEAEFEPEEETDPIYEYWLHNYQNTNGTCSLCDGSGQIFSTSNKAEKPETSVEFCLCPNGRELRRFTEEKAS